jgi:hypothetical protein
MGKSEYKAVTDDGGAEHKGTVKTTTSKIFRGAVSFFSKFSLTKKKEPAKTVGNDADSLLSNKPKSYGGV